MSAPYAFCTAQTKRVSVAGKARERLIDELSSESRRYMASYAFFKEPRRARTETPFARAKSPTLTPYSN